MSEAPRLHWLTNEHEFLELEPEWRQLFESLPHASPFQSPDWLIPWWRAFHEDKELAVLALRRSGQLVGLLPLYRNQRRPNRANSDAPNAHQQGPTRELLLIGTGNTDHLDLLADPADYRLAAAALHGVLELAPSFDVLDLQELSAESPILTAFRSSPLERYKPDIVPFNTCPLTELTAAPGGAPLSNDFRKRIAYLRRRAHQLGQAQLKGPAVKTEPPRGLCRIDVNESSIDQMFELLVALHGARRADKGELGALHDHTARAFHREVIDAFFRSRGSSRLRLFSLALGSRPFAVYYGFERHSVAYNYLSGFDREYQHISPGTLLVAEAFDLASASGCSRFDFLRGKEDYKYRWGAVDRENYRVLLRAR